MIIGGKQGSKLAGRMFSKLMDVLSRSLTNKLASNSLMNSSLVSYYGKMTSYPAWKELMPKIIYLKELTNLPKTTNSNGEIANSK